MLKFIFFIGILSSVLFGLSDCNYKEEVKLSSANDISKTVDDFTGTVSSRVIKSNVTLAGNGVYYTPTYSGSTPNGAKSTCDSLGSNWRMPRGAETVGVGAVPRGGQEFVYTDSSVCNTGYTLSTSSDCKGYLFDWGDVRIYRCVTTDWNSASNLITDCPLGYSGNPCKKTVNYTYKNYTCDANDKNAQGFGWVLASQATNDGSNIDPDTNSINSSTLDDTVYSHTTQPQCKRKYQECSINCMAPLTLETSSGKCVMSYEADCQAKGMIYDSVAKVCTKINQCSNPFAYKHPTSDYCSDIPNCDVVNGVCSETAIKYCDYSNLSYDSLSNRCEGLTSCTASQIPLSNGYCGSTTSCNNNDTETLIDCVNIVNVEKNCAPDGRNNNICFKTSSVAENIPINYRRELIKTTLSGSFKEKEFGELKQIYCSNDDGNCTFRLTKMFTQNNGSELCFQDNVAGFGCIKIDGDCRLDGEISFDKGIRQLFIENNNKSIVGYNKTVQDSNVGIIHSSCSLSGKVGAIDTSSSKREIIAAQASGSEIKFWDNYRRGLIGVITFLPTIPDVDVADGFVYEDPDIMNLYSKGYTGFYTFNNATYAVYNGLISKEDCRQDISGTSFYITQAETDSEIGVLNMLSFLGNNNHNYNDGVDTSGSCVVKSLTAKSFNAQIYSKKQVDVENANTRYVCSPLKCETGYCQYNNCPTNFIGDIIDENDFSIFLNNNHQGMQQSEICTSDYCDSNKPYYPYCGSNYGCVNDSKTYQQSDGSCIQFTCESDETMDYETGKCVKLDCQNSTKRNGKCYKSLEL